MPVYNIKKTNGEILNLKVVKSMYLRDSNKLGINEFVTKMTVNSLTMQKSLVDKGDELKKIKAEYNYLLDYTETDEDGSVKLVDNAPQEVIDDYELFNLKMKFASMTNIEDFISMLDIDHNFIMNLVQVAYENGGNEGDIMDLIDEDEVDLEDIIDVGTEILQFFLEIYATLRKDGKQPK